MSEDDINDRNKVAIEMGKGIPHVIIDGVVIKWVRKVSVEAADAQCRMGNSTSKIVTLEFFVNHVDTK